MKKQTFINLISALIDQNEEDNFKTEKFGEIFGIEEPINIGNKLIDVVFNSVLDEFEISENDERFEIAFDIIFNDILAFKYDGVVYGANLENLYEIFNK